MTSAADYQAANAALGRSGASVPTSKAMDGYNAWAEIVNAAVPTSCFLHWTPWTRNPRRRPSTNSRTLSRPRSRGEDKAGALGGPSRVRAVRRRDRFIKAHGYAQDVKGAWRCWQEMRSRHIRPTSITVGCMVEAVLSNGDTEGGYELIHQMQDDDQCREVLNFVSYCFVLKGFAREKKLERVPGVYEE